MNICKIQITDYLLNEFKDIRVYKDNENNNWYAAIDITKQIGYTNNYKAIKDHCNANGIIKVICTEDGKGHPTLFINEENICRLVLASKINKAQEMKNKIFDFIYS